MHLLTLTLEHFRNHTATTVDFAGADTQLFVGENGSGKTNLLEAVSVLSLTKSCRGRDEQELAQWGATHYRVRAEVLADDGKKSTMEVVTEVSPRQRKACFINDVKTGLGAMVGFLPTVIFLPQDLLLFSGPPAERRRFLDQLLSQVSPDYLADFSAYQKILQQRNALLRNIADGRQTEEGIQVWDRALAHHGCRLTIARLELIETLNLSFAEELKELGEDRWEAVRLTYTRKSVERDPAALEEEVVRLLEKHRQRDLALVSTSVGPHREDWQVMVGERELPTFASRGQERTAVLAILLLEVAYLELRRGERPMVLLDDAFSELDDRHQERLMDALKGRQVILTSTRVPPNIGEARLWRVGGGTVSPV